MAAWTCHIHRTHYRIGVVVLDQAGKEVGIFGFDEGHPAFDWSDARIRGYCLERLAHLKRHMTNVLEELMGERA